MERLPVKEWKKKEFFIRFPKFKGHFKKALRGRRLAIAQFFPVVECNDGTFDITVRTRSGEILEFVLILPQHQYSDGHVLSRTYYLEHLQEWQPKPRRILRVLDTAEDRAKHRSLFLAAWSAVSQNKTWTIIGTITQFSDGTAEVKYAHTDIPGMRDSIEAQELVGQDWATKTFNVDLSHELN